MNALPPFTFSKVIQWARMESLPDRFWAYTILVLHQCCKRLFRFLFANNKNLKIKTEKRLVNIVITRDRQ